MKSNMAEGNVYKQEFSIRNLSTRSVTLYPARAHVIRDVNEIVLKVCSFISVIA